MSPAPAETFPEITRLPTVLCNEMFPLPVTAFRNATLDDDELTALMEPVVVIAETLPAAGTRSEEIATAPFTALRVMARFVVVIWPAT